LPARGSAYPRAVLGIAAIDIPVVGRSGSHVANQPHMLNFTIVSEYKAPGQITWPPERRATTRVISSLNMEPLDEIPDAALQTANGEPIPFNIQRYAQTYTETWDDTNFSIADAAKVGKVDGGDASKFYRSYSATRAEDEIGVYYSQALQWIIHPEGIWDKDFKVKGHVIKNADGSFSTSATLVYIKADGTQGADDGSDAEVQTIVYPV